MWNVLVEPMFFLNHKIICPINNISIWLAAFFMMYLIAGESGENFQQAECSLGSLHWAPTEEVVRKLDSLVPSDWRWFVHCASKFVSSTHQESCKLNAKLPVTLDHCCEQVYDTKISHSEEQIVQANLTSFGLGSWRKSLIFFINF